GLTSLSFQRPRKELMFACSIRPIHRCPARSSDWGSGLITFGTHIYRGLRPASATPAGFGDHTIPQAADASTLPSCLSTLTPKELKVRLTRTRAFLATGSGGGWKTCAATIGATPPRFQKAS